MKRVSIHNLSFNVSDNNLDFWNKVNENSWEKDTFTIFDNFLNEKSLFFDIGAWIGPTVLYAAQLSKSAFAFEPDPVAYGILDENLELNKDAAWYKKVTLINKAAGRENGFMNLGSKSGGGDSLSSVLFADNETHWKVETISVPDFVEKNCTNDYNLFFKIDIEGGEYSLIPALIDTFSSGNSILFLSFHPGNLFSAFAKENPGIIGKISSWMKVTGTHFDILKLLPYKYRYLQSGRKLTMFNLLYYTVRLRSFSIVALNNEWIR